MQKRVLTTAKKIRNLEESPRLVFAVERSLEMIGSYLHSDEIPSVLLGVGVDIALWIYDKMEEEAPIQKIKEGEVEITFAPWGERMQADAEEILHCFSTELNRLRRMDW